MRGGRRLHERWIRAPDFTGAGSSRELRQGGTRRQRHGTKMGPRIREDRGGVGVPYPRGRGEGLGSRIREDEGREMGPRIREDEGREMGPRIREDERGGLGSHVCEDKGRGMGPRIRRPLRNYRNAFRQRCGTTLIIAKSWDSGFRLSPE